MPLTPGEVATLSRLLDEGRTVPAAEREAWLQALPGDVRPLADHLRGLLAEEGSPTGDWLKLPSLAEAGAVAHEGDRIGPYRLVREIGRGGMGSVWLAERADGSFERQVALKLPRIAWSEQLDRRMAREQRIGARLEHPAIARMYDAGVDERGRPYIAMEFIEGQPIDDWCRDQKLGVKARLKLFLQVVRAVAYAHGRFVVHRDLKPANVLVDGQGRAHLLDFGIAKVIGAPGANLAETTQTREPARAHTPRYASPEQVAGLPIGVASDIYALGVTLYELLTGRLPYEPGRATLGALEEAILRGDIRTASSVAPDLPTRRQLSGEVDAILGKALKWKPEERYATADALADDIERHLSGHGVKAKSVGRWYRLRRAIGRHWVPLTAAAVIVVAIAGGGAVFVVQTERATRASERERLVKDFVVDLLRNDSRAAGAGGPPVSAEMRLADVAQLIESRFPRQPLLQAEMLGSVGAVLSDMGADALAIDYAQRQWQLLRDHGAEPARQAEVRLRLAEMLSNDDRPDDARVHAEAALAVLSEPPARKLALVVLAKALLELGDVDGSDRLRARATAIPVSGEPTLADAQLLALDARAAQRARRFREALLLMSRAAELASNAGRAASAAAAEMKVALLPWQIVIVSPANVRVRVEDVLRELSQAGPGAAVRGCVLRARITSTMLRLGQLDLRDARASLQQSRTCLENAVVNVPRAVAAQRDLWEGHALLFAGDIDEAARLVRPAVTVLRPSEQSLRKQALIWNIEANMLMLTGEHQRASNAFRDARDADLRLGDTTTAQTSNLYVMSAVNEVMAAEFEAAGRTIGAIPVFKTAPLERERGRSYPHLAGWVRAMLELEQGHPRDAMSAIEPLQDWNDMGAQFPTQATRAEAQCGLGRFEAGLATLRQVIEARTPRAVPGDPTLARLRGLAGLCALGAGDRRTAMEMSRQSAEAFAQQPGVSPYFRRPLDRLQRALAAQAR